MPLLSLVGQGPAQHLCQHSEYPHRSGYPQVQTTSTRSCSSSLPSRSTGPRVAVASFVTAAAFQQLRSKESREAISCKASMSSDVVVFTRPGCAYCSKAKALLKKQGISFGVVDVSVEPERRQEAVQLSGGSQTVPQMFVGQRSLGGFDSLQKLLEDGKLLDTFKRKDEDGPSIIVTPPEALAAADPIPEAVRSQLASRVEVLRSLKYQAGSRPSLWSFIRYAFTRKVEQDQSNNQPLNLAAVPGEPAPSPALPTAGALELARLLRQTMLVLLDSFMDPTSGDVDYVAMRSSEQWQFFRAVASELGDPRLQNDLLALSVDDRKAFFINLYNAMTFHGVVAFGKRAGSWYLFCFYITPAVSYRLAGFSVSLDDVEHGLLRARPQYFQDEVRSFLRRLKLPDVDARIHMALNCASRGCPAVAVYTGGPELGKELDEATAGFIADDGNFSIKKVKDAVEISLSEIFKMYLEDFAGSGAKASTAETNLTLARWLLQYARGEKKELLEKALATGSPSPRVTFSPYDWEVNGTEVPVDSYVYTPGW